jgi:hypothetical protein
VKAWLYDGDDFVQVIYAPTRNRARLLMKADRCDEDYIDIHVRREPKFDGLADTEGFEDRQLPYLERGYWVQCTGCWREVYPADPHQHNGEAVWCADCYPMGSVVVK